MMSDCASSSAPAVREAKAPFVLSPQEGSEHTGTVLFLHGLGGSGEGWLPVAHHLQETRPGLRGVKWVLVNAARRAITSNFGQEMQGWYDVHPSSSSSHSPREEDLSGLCSSISQIHSVLEEESRQLRDGSNGKLALVGFSQGGAVSLASGLTWAGGRLAGVGALGGYLMGADVVERDKSQFVPRLPVFVGHGRSDGVVGIERNEQSVRLLQEKFGYELAQITPRMRAGPEAALADGQGGTLTVRYYEGLGHEAGEEELEDLASWLVGVLGV